MIKHLRVLFDNFTLALIGVMVLAAVLPARGAAAPAADGLAIAAVALLFFLHGAKLSREAVVAGVTHWRLHSVVFACTFIMFPALGLLLKPVLQPLTGKTLYIGMIYLCLLPATVQSAIAFTSLARGNVPAAVCSAAASSLIGIVITPLLVMLVMDMGGTELINLGSAGRIVMQLLVPFIAGQLARPWIGGWIGQRALFIRMVDQGSILLIVYAAFSASVVAGLWQTVPLSSLLGLTVACCILLAIVLLIVWQLTLHLDFGIEDRITILFGGSKKSMATGVPMAQILFSASTVGIMILPLMIFHQIQLMVCAVLARKFSERPAAAAQAMA